MNYQKIVTGAIIGSAVVGIGFMLFHPAGRKIRRKAMDLGIDAADKLIDYIRKSAHENVIAEEPRIRTRPSAVPDEM